MTAPRIHHSWSRGRVPEGPTTPRPPRKRSSRATPRTCIQCGASGWGSRTWSQRTRRCQSCRAIRRAAREARRRAALRLRRAGLTYEAIGEALDCDWGVARGDVLRQLAREEGTDAE